MENSEPREQPNLETDNPTCDKDKCDLVRKPNMFYWRGRYFHGLVCERHNALYDDPSDSFWDATAPSISEP